MGEVSSLNNAEIEREYLASQQRIDRAKDSPEQVESVKIAKMVGRDSGLRD